MKHLAPLLYLGFAVLTELPVRGEPSFTNSPLGAVLAVAPAPTGDRDPSKGNQIAILNDGYEALLLRVHLIRRATRSIDIQTFIWTNDECGRLLMCELIEAARRGVKIRIIADQLATEKDPGTVAFLATVHPNIEIKHYRPPSDRINPSLFHVTLSALRSLKGMNQRMHNKLMVFDNAVMITGGRNIENTYFSHSTELNFRDRDVLAIGPVAGEAARSFGEYWDYSCSVPSRALRDVAAAIEKNEFRRYATRDDYDFGGFFTTLTAQADSDAEIQTRFVSALIPAAKVRLIVDKPGKNRHFFFWGQGRITHELGLALRQAKQAIVMQTPYLVLSPTARKMIQDIRKKSPGIRIAISSNSFGSTDNLFAYSANYRLRATAIEDLGLFIYEYKPIPEDLLRIFPQFRELERRAALRKAQGQQQRMPFLCIHAKSFVVDDRIAYIGSYNLDPRSENLNTEIGLLIEDSRVATNLSVNILADVKAGNSWVIAKRRMPLHLDKVNAVLDGILGLSPIDIWPIQNSTSFDLIPGKKEVPPDSPLFYDHYREVGNFPGAEGSLSQKEITTRLLKAVGPLVTPIL